MQDRGRKSTLARQRVLLFFNRHRSLKILSLLGSSLFWLGLFFLLPLFLMFFYSFAQKGPYGGIVYHFSLENYRRFFDPLYVTILIRSFKLALLTTILCLITGYPIAYRIAFASKKWKNILLFLIILPFWTSFLIRTYAWILLLRDTGLINNLLLALRLIEEPLKLLYTEGAVLIGMVYGFLPFMVLPLYASIEKLDKTLLEAAEDLGATPLWRFVKVTLPLTLPGVIAGSILVFIPSVAAFVTPDLLGGAKTIMMGSLIQNQFGPARDWPFGSAISFILMILVLISIFIYLRFTTEHE
jgi:spermidine/putrescine transport system permease protein